MKFFTLLVMASLWPACFLGAQETGAPEVPGAPGPDFTAGEELFIRNKPAEALPYLEKAFVADQSNVNTALYLAMCYEQLDRLDEAITVYRRILSLGGAESARIAFNLGNVYYRKGSASSAEQYYTQAIRSDPSYASAYLNRANTRIKTGALRDALPDYERYLALAPESSKRPQIEKLVALIREEFAAEEIRRLMAEEAALAEAERRQRLMDEVSASLQAQADEAEGVSATAEDISGYEGEFELE
ncbi:MAG: tetratricopeptide repeat protein [Spirochaetaceae bacterium]|jgi:tetratricopeptide (TPR) repeat protein|nr:tetratricopeptide repeat protein [Spirochaetaceae bacterium]